MTYKVVITPEAESDLVEAFNWYETQKQGLGSSLLDSIKVSLNQVAENPFLFPEIHRNIRRHLAKTFPYSVLYTIESGQVTILSFFHVRRDSRKWGD